jgi:hypothetical protein
MNAGQPFFQHAAQYAALIFHYRAVFVQFPWSFSIYSGSVRVYVAASSNDANVINGGARVVLDYVK